jgi:exodeoxyribonuclease-5
MLTNCQENALKLVRAYLPSKQTIFIDGYAGTGKSYLINVIIKEITHNFDSVTVMTFANKALDVLVDKLENTLTYDARTLHSFVYGAPDKEGKWVPKVDKLSDGLVIIDEISMVPKYLLDLVIKKLNNCMVILVGDTFQLESVGGEDLDFSAYPKTTMTEVVRYENGILKTANELRTSGKLLLNDDVKIVDNFYDVIKFAATNEFDFVIVTATNRARVDYNKYVRQIQGRESVLTDNEVLIALNNTKSFSNGSIFTVAPALCTRVELPYKGTELQGYRFTIEKNAFIIIPEFLGASLHLFEFNDLPLPQKNLLFGVENVNQHTGRIDNIVICTYGYSMSGHKCQGSQWELVFIDFNYCSPKWNRLRWLYTAITRASKAVRLVPSNYLN